MSAYRVHLTQTGKARARGRNQVHAGRQQWLTGRLSTRGDNRCARRQRANSIPCACRPPRRVQFRTRQLQWVAPVDRRRTTEFENVQGSAPAVIVATARSVRTLRRSRHRETAAGMPKIADSRSPASLSFRTRPCRAPCGYPVEAHLKSDQDGVEIPLIP